MCYKLKLAREANDAKNPAFIQDLHLKLTMKTLRSRPRFNAEVIVLKKATIYYTYLEVKSTSGPSIYDQKYLSLFSASEDDVENTEESTQMWADVRGLLFLNKL